MIRLKTPLKTKDVASLKIGDKILLRGTIFTARDQAHLFLLKSNFSKIRNGVIYHAGPLVKKKSKNYEIISAGPTTSSRFNLDTPKIIKKYGLRAIIGKGGMDEACLKALKGQAVYFSAVGGAGVVYAKSVVQVKNVYKLDSGPPEAIWELEVKDFPVIVTMDSHSQSIYQNILKNSHKKLSFISSS